jgi:hypothetical protein
MSVAQAQKAARVAGIRLGTASMPEARYSMSTRSILVRTFCD